MRKNLSASIGAAAFFDFSSPNLTAIGIAGTEGKSSAVSFIWQLLRLRGKSTGFISAAQYFTNGGRDTVKRPEQGKIAGRFRGIALLPGKSRGNLMKRLVAAAQNNPASEDYARVFKKNAMAPALGKYAK
ncbi:MAG: hypothetical protein Pg6C_13170 [Treponemataceae bacterium]|nr:MAG: hypothetical protein Pg6C_13170 [Treponemataceae bacterium]